MLSAEGLSGTVEFQTDGNRQKRDKESSTLPGVVVLGKAIWLPELWVPAHWLLPGSELSSQEAQAMHLPC